tara:strand:+ start:1583 stop:2854 length:1272 start_codon:yes stop_codon:yes gene_type:complete
MLVPLDDHALIDDERAVTSLTQQAVEGICLLKEITNRLNKEGASQEIAIMIESIDPEALPERYPRESFTQDPSPTNLAVALESAVQAALKAVNKAAKAVIEFIVKLYNAVLEAISKLFDKVARVVKGQKRADELQAKSNEMGAELDGEAIEGYKPEDGSYQLNDRVEFDDGEYKLTLHYDIIKEALSPLVVRVFEQNLTPGIIQQNIIAALQDAKSTNARYEQFVEVVNNFNDDPTNATLQELVSWLRNEEEREHFHDIKPLAALVDQDKDLHKDLPNLMGHGLGAIITLLNQEDKMRYEGEAATDPIFKRMVRSHYDLEQLSAFGDFEKQIKKLDKGINGIHKSTFTLVERGWSPEVREKVQQSVNVYLEYFRNRSRFNTQIVTTCAVVVNALTRFTHAQQQFESKLYGELLTVKELYKMAT